MLAFCYAIENKVFLLWILQSNNHGNSLDHFLYFLLLCLILPMWVDGGVDWGVGM